MMWRTPVTQAFADALDGRRPAKGEVAELVAVATRLCEVAAETAPSAEFRSALRTRLMTSAVPAQIHSRPARAMRLLSTRRTSGIRGWAAVFAAMMATTFGAGMSVASADTVPGDTLYPVKRILENGQLAFKHSDGSRGAFRLTLATKRLTEVDQLTSASDNSTELTSSTFNEFQRQTDLGSEALLRSYLSTDSRQDLVALNRFSTASARRLAELDGRLSTAQIEQAQNMLDHVATQSTRMCPTCEGSTAPSVNSATPSTPLTDAPTIAKSSSDVSSVRSTGPTSAAASATGATDQPSAPTSSPAASVPSPKLPDAAASNGPPVEDLVQQTVVDPLRPLKDSASTGLSHKGGKLLNLSGQD